MTAARPAPSATATPARRKRSRHVALVLAGTATLALAGCKEDRVDAQAFPDLQSCIAAAQQNGLWFSEEDCRNNFAEAGKNHAETAPRYDGLALCEQEHGKGNCQADPAAQASGGGMGSVFMPLMMGYLMGSMLSRGGGVFSQPLSRTADGGYATPNGQQRFSSNNAAGKVAPTTFNRAPTTLGKAPMTPAQVASRGGFGASRSAATGRTGGIRSGG